MPCDVFDGFEAMTESLNPDLYSRLHLSDPWMPLVERGVYPKHTGYTQTVTTLNNSEPPTSTPTWGAINPVSEENPSGPCEVVYADVTWGNNRRQYSPEEYGLQGPILCKDEFTFDWMTDQFLNHYIDQLAMITRRVWSNRYQEHFMALTTKYIADGTNTEYVGSTLAPGVAQATLPGVLATSELTQDMLDYESYQLIYNGATATTADAKGYISLGEQGPIFPLLIGLEMSKRLTFQAEVIDNYRWAGSGRLDASELMKRVGATKVLYNFRHIPNLYPPRFEWDGDSYVRVEPFITSTATGSGTQALVNADWINATYEAAFILHPLVMKDELVEPDVNAGGLPFDPTNYYGNWQFVRGAYKWDETCEDPLKKKGRHYAEFKHAIKPIFPDYGRTIIFKRCLGDPSTVECYGS